MGLAWCGLGIAVTHLGEPQTGLEYIQKGLKIQNSAGVKANLFLYYDELSNAHFDLGDLKNALDCVTKALKLARDINDKLMEGASRIGLGSILVKSDPSQRDKAEESLLEGINLSEELRTKSWYSVGYLYLGEVYADTGQKDKALEILKKAEGMFKEMGMDYWLVKTDEVLKRL